MDTRAEIMTLGEQLIRTKGYHAFSYADIAKALGIKNAAIHYYFATKCDLGTAIIQKAIQQVHTSADEWKKLPEDVQFKKIIKTYFNSHEKGMVCLMGALSAAYDTLPLPMQVQLKEMGIAIIDWVTRCLNTGKKKGLFQFKESAQDKATLLVSNMLSSLLLSRVIGKKIFSIIHRQVLASVN